MTDEPAIWIDGREGRELPLPDRGLDYGDGLFETLLLKQGAPLFLDVHLARLGRGLEILAFPALRGAIEKQLQQACDDITSREWPWTALRLTVTRGSGPRGYAPPAESHPRIVITATRLQRDCTKLSLPLVLSTADIGWPEQPALSGVKHLNRLEQVLAAAQAQREGVDDCLMLDRDGNAVSTTSGNLFLCVDDTLLTPPLGRCGIAGTRRELVMRKWAPSIGLSVAEQHIEPTMITRAQEVFVSNSLIGLRPVASVPGVNWSGHALCEALFQRYREDLV